MDLEDYILLSRIPKQVFAARCKMSRIWLRVLCQGKKLPNKKDMALILEQCEGKVTEEEIVRYHQKKKQERLEKAVLDILASDNST